MRLCRFTRRSYLGHHPRPQTPSMPATVISAPRHHPRPQPSFPPPDTIHARNRHSRPQTPSTPATVISAPRHHPRPQPSFPLFNAEQARDPQDTQTPSTPATVIPAPRHHPRPQPSFPPPQPSFPRKRESTRRAAANPDFRNQRIPNWDWFRRSRRAARSRRIKTCLLMMEFRDMRLRMASAAVSGSEARPHGKGYLVALDLAQRDSHQVQSNLVG